MSELTKTVRRMVSQAHGFVTDAPLEAVSRAKQAMVAARAGLETATGEERDELTQLHELAETRLPRYEQALAAWAGTVRERAALFHKNEVERLQQPLPPKV
jgi:hypothetical protein